VRQPVQRADAVTQLGDEPASLDELADARREIVDGRVDEGNDQHFLIPLELAA
jgi:hypothetical protein